jgi:hypothetical protein
MKCYYDGSYGKDRSGDNWITIAGVAGTEKVWRDFDLKWNRMLGERYPRAPYIHMSELLGRDDPFDSVNGWTTDKKRQLIADAITVLSQIDKNEFRLFRYSINETAIERLLQSKEIVVADPHKHCALLLIESMVNSYWSNCPDPEKIFLIYDRGERFMPEIKREWQRRRTPPGKPCDPTNVWNRIEDISDANQAFTLPLQVADMVAWAHTRTLPTDQERQFSDLTELLIKFVPSTRLDVDEKGATSAQIDPVAEAAYCWIAGRCWVRRRCVRPKKPSTRLSCPVKQGLDTAPTLSHHTHPPFFAVAPRVQGGHRNGHSANSVGLAALYEASVTD